MLDSITIKGLHDIFSHRKHRKHGNEIASQWQNCAKTATATENFYKIPLALISKYLLIVSKVKFSGWVKTE